jgi:hypothetical protein
MWSGTILDCKRKRFNSCFHGRPSSDAVLGAFSNGRINRSTVALRWGQ